FSPLARDFASSAQGEGCGRSLPAFTALPLSKSDWMRDHLRVLPRKCAATGELPFWPYQDTREYDLRVYKSSGIDSRQRRVSLLSGNCRPRQCVCARAAALGHASPTDHHSVSECTGPSHCAMCLE